jgi:hypothetical protein
MAVVNGYCSAVQLRTHLGDASSNLTTELLERAVNAASRAIDHYCQRRFWLDSGVSTRTYEVDDQWCAYVDDIGSRTGLIVKTGTDGRTFPTTLTDGTDFILEPRNADQYASSDFDAYAFWQVRMIGSPRLYPSYLGPTLSVTARHGWSAVPPEIEQACLLKAASLFKRKDAPFGVAGFNELGLIRITRDDPGVVDLITRYRIPVVG